MNVKEAMKIVENKMELKKSFTYSQKEVDFTKEKAELKKSQKFKPEDTSEIEMLTKQMTELTLLVKKRENVQRNPSSITCFNCGEKGHTSRECQKPYNRDLQDKLVREFKENGRKNLGNQNSAMLVLNTANKDSLLFVDQELNAAKRIRIDDLLDNNFSPVPKSVPRAGELKEKVSIGRPAKQKYKAVDNPIFPEQIIELQAPLSIHELLQIRPKSLDDMIKTLKQIKRDKAKRAIVDTGASFCIVSKQFLTALGVSYSNSEPREFIKPVDCPDLIVKGKVILNISFAEDVNIAVKFHVLATCAVPIILGRDVFQALKSNLNYEEETCRESLSEQLGDEPILDELFDEESDSSEDEESDSTALFLNLNQHEIIGAGLPPNPVLSSDFSIRNMMEMREPLGNTEFENDLEKDMEMIELTTVAISFEKQVETIVGEIKHVSWNTKR
ncbi:hypothetical protein AYI69_g10898 [Smittium culicis]|uniref:CCHC-type domain-containing protein n=1 Tax=Smittium culicis TaxID=133412 RepID=A0A1R1X2R1_9FUNG|nr:hypothetical protein AYI69_g10898 [Smittium culicis]